MSIRLVLGVFGGARGRAMGMARSLSMLVPKISEEARRRLEVLTRGVGVTGYETVAELREKVDAGEFQRLHVETFEALARDPEVQERWGKDEKVVRDAYERYCESRLGGFLYRECFRELLDD